MKYRNILVGGEIVCCEWHAKYKPKEGRIHFNMIQGLSTDTENLIGKKLIVGLFCGHLPT
jgi:hypothetical protein